MQSKLIFILRVVMNEIFESDNDSPFDDSDADPDFIPLSTAQLPKIFNESKYKLFVFHYYQFQC